MRLTVSDNLTEREQLLVAAALKEAAAFGDKYINVLDHGDCPTCRQMQEWQQRILALLTESGTAVLKRHDAELRAPGPCCKHPKIFWCEAVHYCTPSGNCYATVSNGGPLGCEPAHCTICTEVADKVKAAVLPLTEQLKEDCLAMAKAEERILVLEAEVIDAYEKSAVEVYEAYSRSSNGEVKLAASAAANNIRALAANRVKEIKENK